MTPKMNFKGGRFMSFEESSRRASARRPVARGHEGLLGGRGKPKDRRLFSIFI